VGAWEDDHGLFSKDNNLRRYCLYSSCVTAALEPCLHIIITSSFLSKERQGTDPPPDLCTCQSIPTYLGTLVARPYDRDRQSDADPTSSCWATDSVHGVQRFHGAGRVEASGVPDTIIARIRTATMNANN
jgi:hypothetical protein